MSAAILALLFIGLYLQLIIVDRRLIGLSIQSAAFVGSLDLLDELHERSEGRHESGAFLLGAIDGADREVSSIIFYDDLVPKKAKKQSRRKKTPPAEVGSAPKSAAAEVDRRQEALDLMMETVVMMKRIKK